MDQYGCEYSSERCEDNGLQKLEDLFVRHLERGGRSELVLPDVSAQFDQSARSYTSNGSCLCHFRRPVRQMEQRTCVSLDRPHNGGECVQ